MDGANRFIRALVICLFFFSYSLAASYSASVHLTDDYFVIPIDINADGREDRLFQSLTPGRDSTVSLGNGSDVSMLPLQALEEIDPELDWDREHSFLHVGDFNGDGRDDLYLQGRAAGSPQAFVLADETGRYLSVSEKFSGPQYGFDWSAAVQEVVVGDYDGNGQSELLLRGHDPFDIHLVMRPNRDGTLNTTGPSWVDGHLDLPWHTAAAELHPGDFNGDGRTDLVWRSREEGDADPRIAILLASEKGEFTEIAVKGDDDFLDAEWDPATHFIQVADINGDGIDDIVSRAHSKSGTNYLLLGDVNGRFEEVAMRWQGMTSATAAYDQHVDSTESGITVQTMADSQKIDPPSTHGATRPRTGAVGALQGEFSVDPTGASNYRISIEVPPGVGGMQPDLAFLYSSRAGNGLLGQGWSLSGLSAITRCPRSIAQSADGKFDPVTFENTDAFCLDGQLLKKKGSGIYGNDGVIYGTEISSFQRVESKGGDNTAGGSYTGPDHFVVKDKAGLIREYGNSNHSRQEVAGKSVVKQWALSRIRDRFGNYIHFKYAKVMQDGMLAYQPSEISWHNRNNVLIGKVVLEYEDRLDIVKGSEPFANNGSVHGNSLFKRLRNVKVYARGSLVRTYRIRYEQLRPSGTSAIDSIEMCAASGACMPATFFEWSESVEGFGFSRRVERPDGLPISLLSGKFGDMNGDGRTDALYFVNDVLHWVDLVTLEVTNTGVNVGDFHKSQAVITDYDGDGLSDLLIASPDMSALGGEPSKWHVISQDGDGSYSMINTGAIAYGWNEHPVPIDLDMDGYPELVFIDIFNDQVYFYRHRGENGFDPNRVSLLSYRVSGSQRILPGEFNGDGLPDFMLTSKSGDNNGNLYLSDGNTFQRKSFQKDGSTTYYSTEGAVVADINGDGLTDVIAKKGFIGDDSGSADWYTYINIGGHFKRTAQRPDETDARHMATRIVDGNRDGIADVLLPRGDHWSSSRYNVGSDAWSSAGFPMPHDIDETTEFYLFDVNGDGVTDILEKDGNYWRVRLGTGNTPGLMTRAMNGLGDLQEVRYWQISRVDDSGSIYLGHDPSDEQAYDYYTQDPDTDDADHHYRQVPVTVVSEIETGTGTLSGAGDERRIRTSYRYAGAMVNTKGRGFLGFRMLASTNHNTGIETVNIHRQAYPYTGMVEQAIQKIPDTTITTLTPDPIHESCFQTRTEPDPRCGFSVNEETSTTPGPIISETTSEFGKRSASQTADGGVYPYVSKTIETTYQYPPGSSHDKVRSTVTEYTYAGTGDPTSITVTTDNGSGGDEHKVVTSNTYDQNDTGGDWCLGRLTRSEVTHSRAQGSFSGTRIATFGYDQTVGVESVKTCRLKTEVANADTAKQVTKTYQFDDYGNKQVTTATTADGSRSTTRSYDYYGLYPISTVNDLGHRESYIWDYRFGVKRASTGPNGLTTIRVHDGFGRVVNEIAPRTAVTTTREYQWCGSGCISDSAVYYTRASSSIGSKTETVTEYDALGREVAGSRYDKLGNNVVKTETIYDSLGRPYLQSLPFVNKTERCWQHTIYDLLGRPKVVSTPPNDNACNSTVPSESDSSELYPDKATYYTYAGLTPGGLKTTVTDQDGRTKSTWKNVLDRVVKVTEHDGQNAITTSFGYDVFGNTTTVVQPGSAVVQIGYDIAGNKTSMTDPDMGSWTYGYTGFGELEWQEDAEGNRVEMQYDALGRMTYRVDNPGTADEMVTEWFYDDGYGASIGKPVHVAKSDGYAETYAYNEYGQVTDTVKLIDGEVFWTSQSYDAYGRSDIVVYPDVATFDTGTTPIDSTDLALTVPSSSNGTHTISWTNSASDFARYELYRNDADDLATAEQVYNGPLKSHTDTVDADGDWYYWLKAFHGDTEAITGGGPVDVKRPPAPPPWLLVEDFDTNHDGSIDLSWGESTGASSYEIFSADTFNGDYTAVKTVTAPSTSTVIANLDDGEYYFQVRACKVINAASVCSDPTYGFNPAGVIMPPPTAPKPVLVESDGNNNGVMLVTDTVTVSWDISATPDVNAYEVDIYNVTGGSTPVLVDTFRGDGNELEFSGLNVGEYQFKVRLCKSRALGIVCSVDDSPFSDVLNVGVLPDALDNLAGPVSGYSDSAGFLLTFDNPQDMRRDQLFIDEAIDSGFTQGLRSFSYELQGCGNDGEGEPIPPVKCPPPESLQVTNVASGEKWYRIKACTMFGCSDWTATPSPTDVRVPPADPAAVHAPSISSTGDYTISWDASPADASVTYKLYESQQVSHADGVMLYHGSQMSFDVTGKPDGENFYYLVQACYLDECSTGTEAGNGVRVIFPPTTPATFSVPANDDDGDYVLMWTESSGRVDEYVLEQSLSSDFTSSVGIPVEEACMRYDTGDGGCIQYGPVGNTAVLDNQPDGTYFYRVKACNEGGCSNWKNGNNGIEVLSKPDKPSGISVPTSSTTGDFTIDWASANGQVDDYELYEATQSDFSDQQLVYSGSSLSKSLTGRSDGRYRYRVRACNASGCGSYRTGANPLDVLHKPGTPGSMSLPSTTNYTGSYGISWGASSGAVSSYTLQESTNSNYSGATNINIPQVCDDWWHDPDGPSICRSWVSDTSTSVSGRADGTYYYRVRGCNSSGCSSWRNGSNAVTVQKTPSRPSSISSPSGSIDGYITVTWGSSTGNVTKYQLFERENGGSWTRIYNSTGRTKTVWRPNGTYDYRVRACNGSYCSSYRGGASTTVYIRDPGGPNPMRLLEESGSPEHETFGSDRDGLMAGVVTQENKTSEDLPVIDVEAEPAVAEMSSRIVEIVPVVTETADAGEVSADEFIITTGVRHEPRVVTASAENESTHSGQGTRVAAVKINHDIDRTRGGFRAMPPQRPADFYRSLRVGKPADTRPAHTAATHSTGRADTRAPRARPVKVARTATASGTRDDSGEPPPVEPRYVEPIAPLRNDPRLRRGTESTTTTTASTKPSGDSLDGGFTTLKFGETNEPTGTYAHAVKHEYHSATGILLTVRECVDDGGSDCAAGKGQTYWQATAFDIAGNLTEKALGNGLVTRYDIDRVRGTVDEIETLDDSTQIQHQTYTWDLAGNLTSRHDALIHDQGGINQTFEYDGLNRLTYSKTEYNVSYLNDDTRYNHYADNGNIRCFNTTSASCSDDYSYHSNRPHAVEQVSGVTGSYGYNANGAMETGPNGRNIQWTAFSKPSRIDGNGAYAEFAYDANRSRYRMTASDGTDTTITTYIGALYERVETGSTTTHRFHIFAGGEAIAVYSCTTDCGEDPDTHEIGDTEAETRYFHKDHLGSITAITSGKRDSYDNIVVLERFHYSAWGQQMSWIVDGVGEGMLEPADSDEQDRGFTGHVMLNDLGLIHMNGRIYDPGIGRFISADPFVQFPHSTQGYNRYTYVGNNPLSYTDPSGYFSLKEALGVAVGIVGMVSCGPTAGLGCALASGAITGAVGGYLATGTLQGALTGAALGMASAGVAYGVGEQFGHQLGFGADLFKKSLVHGLAQGALSTAGGGRFGDGFLGAFAGSMMSPITNSIGGMDAGSRAARITVAAVVGGTASKLGGGRFANGAITGAFVQAYNDEMAAQQFKKTLEEFRTNVVAHENVSVTEEDGITRININGTVGGDGVSKFVVDKFIDGVKGYWEGSFEFDGKVYEVSVNLEHSGLMSPDFELQVVRGEAFYRSEAMHGGNVATIWRQAPASTMAHEFGHMLGFGDMYTDSGGVFAGFENDIMGASRNGSVHGYHAAMLALKYGN